MNLLELVEAGDLAGVLRELGTLTLEQRASYAADLTARYEAMSSTEWLRLPDGKSTAQCAAELGARSPRRLRRPGS